MTNFTYLQPTSLKEALATLDHFSERAKPLAGGTDLTVGLQKGNHDLDVLVDLKRVPELGSTVTYEKGSVVVGARVVLADLIEDERVQRHLPALVEAARTVGSVQIRNRATLAGNICNASPAADTVPPLLIYNAVVQLASSSGERVVPIHEFFVGPGKTIRKPGEIVLSVTIPVPEEPCGAAFGRLARRRGVDLATTNMACAIRGESDVKFAFGAVGPTAVLVQDESGKLARAEIPASERDGALRALFAQIAPISDVRASKEYRSDMVMFFSRRVLAEARQRYET